MIDEATITAIVVAAQRKTKCLMLIRSLNLFLSQRTARKHLPTSRSALNELKSLTIFNLCRKRPKLSKAKIKRQQELVDRLSK